VACAWLIISVYVGWGGVCVRATVLGPSIWMLIGF